MLAVAGVLLLGAAGCGEDDAAGGSSPEAAVERFLAAFAQPPKPQGSTASEVTKEFWAAACDRVDPRIRRGLRFDDDEPIDPRVSCGATVVLAVMYTGDTGQMAAPSAISGRPVGTDTSRDESVVRVEMRYRIDESRTYTAPAPPAVATVNVLVVKRDGSWWVATPKAFNPLHAADGGYSESELRKQHRELLAAR